MLGLIGESGCGKSVTAQSIVRLHKGIIDQGEILYLGEDILNKSTKELEQIRGQEIAMIFQDPMTSLNPTMRIGKQKVSGMFNQWSSFKKMFLVCLCPSNPLCPLYPFVPFFPLCVFARLFPLPQVSSLAASSVVYESIRFKAMPNLHILTRWCRWRS